MSTSPSEYDRLIDQLAHLRGVHLASVAGIDALTRQVEECKQRAAEDEGLPRLLTALDVAGILGVHTKTVYQWVREGTLPSVRLSEREIRVRDTDLRDWIASRPPASEYTPPVVMPRRSIR